jgi:hypothetical protein
MHLGAIAWIGICIGSIAGWAIPMLYGADVLSYSAIIGSSFGSLLGWGLALKLQRKLAPGSGMRTPTVH